MKVNELISALRTLTQDCPAYGNVPVLVEVSTPDGEYQKMDVGFHHDDGAGDEGSPTRLLLTVVTGNYDELEDRFINEAPDARVHGDTFKPNTELYGRKMKIYDANNEPADNSCLEGTLKEITGMHTYLVTMADGSVQEWEVVSVNDLTVEEDGTLTLWNAF